MKDRKSKKKKRKAKWSKINLWMYWTVNLVKELLSSLEHIATSTTPSTSSSCKKEKRWVKIQRWNLTGGKKINKNKSKFYGLFLKMRLRKVSICYKHNILSLANCQKTYQRIISKQNCSSTSTFFPLCCDEVNVIRYGCFC